jgi:hypothetical protein
MSKGKKKRPSRRRRGLPSGQAGVRGNVPPQMPSMGMSVLSNPGCLGILVAFAIGVVGLGLVKLTGDVVWAWLIVPAYVVAYLLRREGIRRNQRALLRWLRALRKQ